MDYTEKIKSFDTIDDLKTAMLLDCHTGDMLSQRYCVRFIMLNNFNDYRQIAKFIGNDLKVENLDIESLAYGDDKTVTCEMLLEAIGDKTSSLLLTPFSELVRFYSEEKFRALLNQIILIENIHNTNRRIYVPVIGLHNRFSNFLRDFGRLEESAPIWQFYTKDDKVKVFVTKQKSFGSNQQDGCLRLSTMRDWLRFWKTSSPVAKILCTASPIVSHYHNSKPDSIFSFYSIDNSYQFITDYLEYAIPICYEEKEEMYWEKLLEKIYSLNMPNFSFTGFLIKNFNRTSFSDVEIVKLWGDKTKDSFDRWIIKKYIGNSATNDVNSYLSICIEETEDLSSPTEFFVIFTLRIFHLFTPVEQSKYSEERKQVMTTCQDLFRQYVPLSQQNILSEELTTMIKTEGSFASVKRYCCSVFDFEKRLFTSWYANEDETGLSLGMLQDYYPNLYSYLQPINSSLLGKHCEILCNYLQEYKRCKIQDVYSNEFADMLKTINKTEESFYDWFMSFNEENDLLNKACNFDGIEIDQVYWIDGLGVEFLPFFLNILKTTSFSPINVKVARTGLPSNTHLNAFEGKLIRKFGGLDEIAHQGLYQKYDTLIKELDCIEKIVKQIVADNEGITRNIAIVSDHGLSAMSRLVVSAKFSNDAKHEGRYIALDNNTYISDSEYIVTRNQKDGIQYKVALTHSSLKYKPTHEVHGGATPEEVLVPFLVISNNPKAKPIEYKISLLRDNVPLSNPIAEIDIMPVPKSVTININGKDYQMEKKKVWQFVIPNAKEGNLSFMVVPSGGIAKTFNLRVNGLGFSTISIFDDFD